MPKFLTTTLPTFFAQFLIFFALFSELCEVQAQTISSRKFKEPNKLIFTTEGLINFSAASRNQATNFEQRNLPNSEIKNRNQAQQNIGNDSQIFFKTGVMTQDKSRFGAIGKVEFNYNSDSRNAAPNLDQAFLFADGDFGKVEFGNNQAANQKMKVNAAKIARGAGGIAGKYLENVNLPNSSAANSSGANSVVPGFILLAQSPIGHGGYARSLYSSINGSGANDSRIFNRSNFRSLKDDSFDGVEDATKLTYYSPRIYDLQLGLSYAPDSQNSGITSTKYYDSSLSVTKDIFSFGLNYAKDLDNLTLEIAATAETAKAKNSVSNSSNSVVARRDLFAYDVGFSASYFGFTAATSYGSWGKSLQPKTGIYAENSADSNYYTLGLAYEFGPIAASLTNLKSSFQKNKYRAISLGLDYKLAKDLMPYIEITKFSFVSNRSIADRIDNNRGYVALTGILFSF